MSCELCGDLCDVRSRHKRKLNSPFLARRASTAPRAHVHFGAVT